MKSLILCDGSEGSLRCVEVACAADTSLVLLHVWDKPAASTSTNAHADGPSAPRGAAAGVGATATSEASAAASPPEHGAASVASAAPGGGGSGASPSQPCAAVLTATLKALHTNRYIKGRAHYTVETICATAGNEEGDFSAGATSVQGRPADKPAASFLVAVGESARSSAAVDAAATVATPPTAAEEAAEVVVRHVAHQAKRHAVDAILLGVGQRQEGKVCRLGAVALTALRRLRSTHPLFFVKRDGVKWRPLPLSGASGAATAAAGAGAPSTNPLRFTIVLPLPAPRDDTTRNGNEEGGEEAGVLSAAIKAAVKAVVLYAQLHCLRAGAHSEDSVGFLLIAPSALVGGDKDETESVKTPMSAVSAAVSSTVEVYRQYVEGLLPPTTTSSAAPSSPANAATAAAVVVDEEGAAVVGDAVAATAPSRVSVCALKASKKHPSVTLAEADVALPQVMKHVGSLKPDVLLMPISQVPEALQCALLAASKPHCVVVPC